MTSKLTDTEDYRARWLSTVMVTMYGLGFPLWVMGSTIFQYLIELDGALMTVLVFVWISCFVYAIGPENVKEAKNIKNN